MNHLVGQPVQQQDIVVISPFHGLVLSWLLFEPGDAIEPGVDVPTVFEVLYEYSQFFRFEQGE